MKKVCDNNKFWWWR